MSAVQRRPSCVLQVGFRTWYSGADQRYIEKCKLKDASTTQAALGFKICGMQVGMSQSTVVGGPAGWDQCLQLQCRGSAINRGDLQRWESVMQHAIGQASVCW